MTAKPDSQQCAVSTRTTNSIWMSVLVFISGLFIVKSTSIDPPSLSLSFIAAEWFRGQSKRTEGPKWRTIREPLFFLSSFPSSFSILILILNSSSSSSSSPSFALRSLHLLLQDPSLIFIFFTTLSLSFTLNQLHPPSLTHPRFPLPRLSSLATPPPFILSILFRPVHPLFPPS